MIGLAVANILYRKMRSAITMLAVGIGIAMLLVLVGMTEGSLREVSRRMQGVGADMMVHPEDMNPVLDSIAIMPLSAGPVLQNIEGVKAIAPVILDRMTLKNKNQRVFGIDPPSFRSVGANLEIVEGRLWETPDEIVIDRRLADGLGYTPGGEIDRLGKRLKIVGICEANNGARVLMPIQTLQQARHAEERVSFFLVKCAEGTDVGAVAAEIERRLSFLRVKTLLIQEYALALRKSFKGLQEFIAGVTTVCLVVSFMVILLVLYTNVLERSREIAILKALGASKLDVMKNVIAESLLLCLGGVLVGLLLTIAARAVIGHALPLLTVELRLSWALNAMAIGLAGALLGAMYPALRAARVEPANVLNFE